MVASLDKGSDRLDPTLSRITDTTESVRCSSPRDGGHFSAGSARARDSG